MTKIALHRGGLAVSHLSAFSRGFSPNNCYAWNPTRFGMKVLSPLRTAVENRYLKERVVVPLEGSIAYLRVLERRLRENGLVSIRSGDAGHRTLEVPFLEGSIDLATGPPSLAVATGAALLPVFTVRRGSGAFEVVIEPPLRAPDGRTRHEVVEQLLSAYAFLLESYVRRQPQLWSGWYAMRVASRRNDSARSAPREITLGHH